MDDFPTQIADLLVQTAARVRAMTVDRIAGYTKWAAVGLVVAMLAFVLVVFLLIGLFRWLGELIGVEAAFALVGGLFVIVGMFLWRQKNPDQAKEQ